LARLQKETESSMQKILFKENIISAGTGCIYCTYSLNKKNMQIAELLKQHQIPVYFIIANPSARVKTINTPVFRLNEIHGGILESQRIV
jgi:type II secretory ATPase GspE/PulE/Tfp pilus assembly ATPase PilB-like protein